MFTFKKEERLCSKKLIDELFHNGSSFLLYPFRITWLSAELPAGIPVQVLINVSKRRFKRAHDRNLIKRRVREAYRLHKAAYLYSKLPEGKQFLLAVNFVGKEISSYQFIEKKLIAVFERLIKAYQDERTERDS